VKIILVLTDSRRKNLVFVTDELRVFSLEEIIKLTSNGKIDDTHVVERLAGTYIRTNPSVPRSGEFEQLSLTGSNLSLYLQGNHSLNLPSITVYLKLYLGSLRESISFIEPVGEAKVITSVVKKKLLPHRSIIFAAAEKFDIDPYLFGAILIDEIARILPFEQIYEKFKANIVGRNASVGIAQVKIDTANNLIKQGLYNPNPSDKQLPFVRLDNAGRRHLYDYLIKDKHNIFFAAAHTRSVIEDWENFIDLAHKPAILATLYSFNKKPHNKPEPSDRGLQIANEFYKLSKKWLK
jgi:hypothetical protein